MHYNRRSSLSPQHRLLAAKQLSPMPEWKSLLWCSRWNLPLGSQGKLGTISQSCFPIQMDQTGSTSSATPWDKSDSEMTATRSVRFRQNGNGGIKYDGDNVPVPELADLMTIPTWDQPSPADFLTLLSLFLPMTKWVEDPMLSNNVHHVQRILSNDEKHAETNTIDFILPGVRERPHIQNIQFFVGPSEEVLGHRGRGETETFKREWAVQMGRVRRYISTEISRPSPGGVSSVVA